VKGINKAIVLGTVGRDPEIKYTSSGSAICNLSVATNETWKDKNTGEKQERTEWHRIAAFGKLAEIMGEYLRKGSQVYIDGKIQTRKWQDQSGADRYSTEIVASEMLMVGGRGSFDAHNEGQPKQAPQQHTPPEPATSSFDSEIPF